MVINYILQGMQPFFWNWIVWNDGLLVKHKWKYSFQWFLFLYRWLITSGITAPSGISFAAYDSINVAGAKETGRDELLEGGRVCLIGGGYGPWAVNVQTQDSTEPRVKS